jgi:hypothetical protein
MKTVRMPLSVDAEVMIDLALRASLTEDEDLYAINRRNGIPAEDENMQWLLASIGTKRLLIAILDRAEALEVVIHVDEPQRATKNDWNAAIDAYIKGEQERLGPVSQVTREQLVAYVAGTLSEEDMERVRDFLVAYPELFDIIGEIRGQE